MQEAQAGFQIVLQTSGSRARAKTGNGSPTAKCGRTTISEMV